MSDIYPFELGFGLEKNPYIYNNNLIDWDCGHAEIYLVLN